MTEGTDGGGVAGGDGMLEPEDVAAQVQDCVESGSFLITPHKEVRKYMQRKAADYERWLAGMRRLHDMFGTTLIRAPNAAKL